MRLKGLYLLSNIFHENRRIFCIIFVNNNGIVTFCRNCSGKWKSNIIENRNNNDLKIYAVSWLLSTNFQWKYYLM